MEQIIQMFALATGIVIFSPTAIAADLAPADKATTSKGTETSDATPENETTTPPAQVDATQSGETSDPAPAEDGDATAVTTETTTE